MIAQVNQLHPRLLEEKIILYNSLLILAYLLSPILLPLILLRYINSLSIC